MAKKLTLADQRLLRFPPTASTWECLFATMLTTDPPQVRRCGAYNHGERKDCWLCGTRKPRRPHLIYPAYTAACLKAGIEPGTRWPVKDEPTEAVAPKKTRRKGNR